MFRKKQAQNLFPMIGGAGNNPADARIVDTSTANEFSQAKMEIGICSRQGKRPYQEDEYVAKAFLGQNRTVTGDSEVLCGDTHIIALFDGHAGGRCSKYLSAGILQTLAEDPQFSSNLPQCLKRSFHTINDQFLKLAERMRFQDGSTGICVVIREGKYMIANVGDCRALLVCSGKPIQLSKDQKPTNPEEQKRIFALGGHVANCMGIARVNGVLAVSRAFGNRALRDVIRPDAEITQRTLLPGDEFLVLASDGLWDVLSNAFVCDTCIKMSNQSSQAIANELVSQSLQRGSMDNITCEVVKLAKFVPHVLSRASNSPGNVNKEGSGASKLGEHLSSGGGSSGGGSAGGGSRYLNEDCKDESFHAYPGMGLFKKEMGGGVMGGGGPGGDKQYNSNSQYIRPSTTAVSEHAGGRVGVLPNSMAGTGQQQQQQQQQQRSSNSTYYQDQLQARHQQQQQQQQGNPYGQQQQYNGQTQPPVFGRINSNISNGSQSDKNVHGMGLASNLGAGGGGGGGDAQGNRFMAAYNAFHRDREEAGKKSRDSSSGLLGGSMPMNLGARPMTGMAAMGGNSNSNNSNMRNMGSNMFQSISGQMGGGVGRDNSDANSTGSGLSTSSLTQRLLHSPITTRASANKYTNRVSTANSVSGRPTIRRRNGGNKF